MKKALIAGAASVALAAMPVVGVFAATPVEVVDNLQLTINESCTFSTGSTGLNLVDTINAGATTTWSDASHQFIINCNSENYAVTAVSTDLVKTGAVGTHGTIGYVTNASYTSTATAATADDGVWSAFLTSGDTDAAISKTSSTIKSGTSTTTDTFTVTYKAYAGKAQEKGTYNGTVTYTLTGTNS